MSSKKTSVDPPAKKSDKVGGVRSSKNNRRRSTRNANSAGEADDKKRGRELKDGEDSFDQSMDSDYFNEMLDLLPSADLDCSPEECPAPPGTCVNLHGVILHESPGGLMVLNVRWRNKVYSGALIDIEKNKWSAEKIPYEPSSTPEGSKNFQAPPPVKKIKIPHQKNEENDSDSTGGKKKQVATSPTTPSKKLARSGNNAGKKRTSQEAGGEDTPLKRNKVKNGEFECIEPNCGKKYKNKNGLLYHQRNVHAKNESFEDSGKENKSESGEESDSGDDNFVIDETKPAEETKEEDEKEEESKEETKEENLTEEEKETPTTSASVPSEVATTVVAATSEEPVTTTSVAAITTFVKTEQDVVPLSSTSEQPLKPAPTPMKLEDASGDHPQGSRHTITYEDQASSIEKLFAQTEFSPTVTNLEKFSLAQTVSLEVTTTSSAGRLMETKTVDTSHYAQPSFQPPGATPGGEKLSLEQVYVSDTDSTTPPPVVLKDCDKVFPQDNREPPVSFNENKPLFHDLGKAAASAFQTQPPAAGKIGEGIPLPHMFDTKNTPEHLFRMLSQQKGDYKLSTGEKLDEPKQHSLLEQRLITKDNPKVFPSPPASGVSPKFEKDTSIKQAMAASTSSFNIRMPARPRPEDSSKMKTVSWIPPNNPKDYSGGAGGGEMFKNPPVMSTSFRMQTSKSPMISSGGKRGLGQPVPIAPAPMIQRRESPMDTDQPQISRFTLSDSRLVPNPVEGRGRPRKYRTEPAHGKPAGPSPQEQAKMNRAMQESMLMRKQQSHSPVVRASVIQGSHPSEEPIKMQERIPEGHPMFAHASMQERERIMRERMHAQDLKTVGEIRGERYKGISPPPRMFMSPGERRSMMTPPLSRAPSHSPRESPDMLTKAQLDALSQRGGMEKLPFERGPRKVDMPPLPGASRGGFLDVRERKFMPPPDMMYRDEKEQRLAEFHRQMASRELMQRGYDQHRHDEQEQARAHFLHQQTTMQTGLYRGGSPPPPTVSAAIPASHPATNLVLTRADGAILGPLPHESRSEYKR